jgi:eukaryotic-like serine/threonine-protein kinase
MMGAADSIDGKSHIIDGPISGADDDGSSRTIGPGSPESEPADSTGESAGRDLPTMSAPASGEATLDPSDPDALILRVNPPTAAESSSPRGDHAGTGAERNVRVPTSGDPSAGQAPSVSRERPVPATAGYEILGELGRGGMGVVYKARQLRLNRTVALKMILAGDHAGQEAALRFLAEAEAIAKLQHPNIVQIFHTDTYAGHPYIEMEYVGGGSLADRLDGTPQPPGAAARLVETLARAMAEAHLLGVVHRDLKPGNILLTTDGAPKVADFGLAKLLNVASGLTRTDSVLGSPSYMAPEQAAGKTKEIGPAADQYALGAILYELLVGRPPFRGATVLDTLQQVKTAEPVSPSRLVPGLPRDVETITLKCLQKDPSKRYESAAALADDLRRFQAGEPIVARPVGSLERGWRWCRRNPVVAGSLGAAAAALVAVAVISVVYAAEQGRSRRRIRDLANNLQVSLKESDRRMASLYLERGQSACEKGEIGPGLLWMVESWRSAVSAGDTAWQYASRTNLAAWQGQHPRLTGVFSHANAVMGVAFSPDGKTVLTGCLDGTARLWDAATTKPLGKPLPHQDQVRAVAFSPGGKTVLTGSDDGTARLWDASTGKPLGPPLVHQGWVRAVAFSPGGKTVLTGSDDGTARLWDASTGQPLGEPLSQRGKVLAVAFSVDGKTFVTAVKDGGVQLWDLATARPFGEPLIPQDFVASVAFSPDGKTLLTGCGDGKARLWDAATRQPIGGPLTHQAPVRVVAFSPDGKTLLTASADLTARLWDVATAKPIGPPLPQQAEVWAAAFSPDGKTVLTGYVDGWARLWDAATGKTIGSPMRHDDKVVDVTYSPDGKIAVTVSDDKTARLWDAATGLSLRHHRNVRAVAFSPDGKTFLTGCWDKTAQLWDTATGETIGSPLTHQSAVAAVAISLDGKSLVTAAEDGGVQLWDAATARLLGSPMRHQSAVYAVAFSPDGKTLLTGCWDKTARLWDTGTRQPLGPPMKHPHPVMRVAFSPDGKTLLAASDGMMRVWPMAKLPDDLKRVATWVETLTGLTLDASGEIQILDRDAWLERREAVKRQGGPPVKDAER